MVNDSPEMCSQICLWKGDVVGVLYIITNTLLCNGNLMMDPDTQKMPISLSRHTNISNVHLLSDEAQISSYDKSCAECSAYFRQSWSRSQIKPMKKRVNSVMHSGI